VKLDPELSISIKLLIDKLTSLPIKFLD